MVTALIMDATDVNEILLYLDMLLVAQQFKLIYLKSCIQMSDFASFLYMPKKTEHYSIQQNLRLLKKRKNFLTQTKKLSDHLLLIVQFFLRNHDDLWSLSRSFETPCLFNRY